MRLSGGVLGPLLRVRDKLGRQRVEGALGDVKAGWGSSRSGSVAVLVVARNVVLFLKHGLEALLHEFSLLELLQHLQFPSP